MRIELSNVHKRFGQQHVLRGLNLTVSQGERLALVGANGSGKSTLLRSVMGMLRVEGSLKLDGACPFANRREIAQHLAYVPQIAPKLGASVREILRTVCALRDVLAADIEARAHALGLSLAAIENKPFAELSGGMKQKLLVALAFSSGASLYILDEPTASLDAEARTCFDSLLEEVAERATVILCSHRSDEVARFAGRIVELNEGSIVRDESLEGRAA